jgi:outer membrane protein assembly factor BamB
MKPNIVNVLRITIVAAAAVGVAAGVFPERSPQRAPVAADAPPARARVVPPIRRRVQIRAARQPTFALQPGGGVDLLIQADRQTIRRLRLATEMIGRKQYLQAAELLQKVLDQDKDAFYYPDPEKRDVLSSIRGAAERVIAGMPEDGQAAYRLKYGGVAQGMLDDAMKQGRLDMLQAVVRRYFHCPAGYEAAYRTGVVHQDRGQHLAAALCFERLRELPDVAKKWEPTLSLRAAVCLSRAGLADKAKQALAAFHRRHGNAAVSLGGRSVPGFLKPEDGPAWLAKNFVGASPRDVRETEWALFRGNRRRNGIAPLPAKADDVKWRLTTIVDPVDVTADVDQKEATRNIARLRDVVQSLETANSQRKVPLPPCVHPLVIDGVVIVRTIEFTRAIELRTGTRLWESAPGLYLEADLNVEAGGRSPAVSRQIQGVVWQRVFGDLNRGTMSSDGRYLFSVEESGPAFTSIDNTNDRANPNAPQTPPARANRLAAYDLRTGKWAWEFGGRAGELGPLPLNDIYFLGAPLPIGRRLYCLAEAGSEIRLLAIEQRETGAGKNREVNAELVWSQPLVCAGSPISRDSSRRTSAATVSYADGILVCNTDAGYVIGVNLTSQSLMWAYRYGSQSRPPFPGPFPRPQPPPNSRQTDWFDYAAAISAGKVVITPLGSGEIHCLNLVDGSVAWKKPRGDGLYVAGIVDRRVLVVGRGSVHALNLKDGSPAWRSPAKIDVPSGRGVIAGNRLLVPTRTDGIAVLDVATGALVTKTKVPGGRRPGNLLVSGGTIISQGVDAVEAFPLPLQSRP